MIIKEIKCKTLLTKSRLPETDYCVNPYVGCAHNCVYCYARFMRRFTSHSEEWGDFLDIKMNAKEVLAKELAKKAERGTVLVGSVTDAYQPIESKYKITRSVIKLLLAYSFPVSILTKSSLVTRDIDLLSQTEDCEVGITITTLDANLARKFEPLTSSPKARLDALVKLRNAGIKTYAFIGPVLPGFTKLALIFKALSDKVDFVMIEALNTGCGNIDSIKKIVREKKPGYISYYEDKKYRQQHWVKTKEEAQKLSFKFGIPIKGFYQH